MNRPAASTIDRVITAVALTAGAWVILLHLDGHTFHWLTWGDRDLLRAAGAEGGLPVTGAEVQRGDGARVPGGAYYYLLAIPLLFSPDPLTAWRFCAALEALAMVGLGMAAWRWRGPAAGALAAALCVTLGGWTDGLIVLWNPTLLPVFVVAMWVLFLRMVEARSAQGLALWAAAAGIGAQLHLSVVPVGVLMLFALAVRRVEGLMRALPGAFLALVATYAPYLLDEAARGFPNTARLLAPVGDGGGGQIAQNLPRLARYLATSAVTDGELQLVARVLSHLPWLALLWSNRAGDTARVVRNVTLAAIAVLAVNRGLDMNPMGTGRYVVAFAPGLALTLAASWDTLQGARRGLMLLPAVATLAGGWAVSVEAGRPNLRHWDRFSNAVADIQESQGWTLADVASRTVILRKEADNRWLWKGSDPTDYLLYMDGIAPTGSATSPCAALLPEYGEQAKQPFGVEDLRRTLGREVDGLRLLADVELTHGDHLVTYDVGDERCPSSFGTRYVRTPEEAAIERSRGQIADDEARLEPTPTGVSLRAIAWLPTHREGTDAVSAHFGVLVDLSTRPASLDFALHSNALRGRSWTSGSQLAAYAEAPVVELAGPDGVVRVPIAAGPIGPDGALTPLRVTSQVPSGAYTATLELVVRGGLSENLPPGSPYVPHLHRVVLGPVVVP
jgi:hypothetical protein